jgi:sterol desaturase/sphingolipid hydroxylase (fatty acid hydroxylase superfamily)
MKSYDIKNKGTTSLFQSRFLEALTRTHFAFPVTLYLVFSVLILIYAVLRTELEVWRALYMIPLGMITFSLVEYVIHRWVFHFNAVTEKQKQLKYKIHGVHHEYPRDKDRLVMPPVLSIVLAILFYGFFRMIAGKYVLLFYPGFLSGYSIYLLIHYAIHRYRPPANFLRFLWTHHALHHYKSEDAAFGVSNPVWDLIFGTMPGKKDRELTRSGDKVTEMLSGR